MMQSTPYTSAPPPYTPSPQHTVDYIGQSLQHHGSYAMHGHQAPVAYQSQAQYPPLPQWAGPNSYNPYTSSQQTSQTTLGYGSAYAPGHQQQPQQRCYPLGHKPCVIPQVTKVFGGTYMSPFIRTRVPELEQRSGLAAPELLAFIDGLNEALMANPVLQATSTIETILGFVPLATSRIVGGGLNLAASLNAAGVSITRTKAYMKKANEDLFKPRGLHAQIVKTEKMLGQIGMAADCDVFIQRQYQVMLDNARVENGTVNPIARRMDAFGDRVMELSIDGVDAPVAPDNWMKKLGVYQAQRADKKQLAKLDTREAKSERRSARAERKLNRAKRNQAEAQEIMDDTEEIRVRLERLDPSQQGYEEAHWELTRERRELKRDLRAVDTERHSRRAERKDRRFYKRTQKRQDKQAEKMKKILWIVIMAEGESRAGDDDWAVDEDSELDSVEGGDKKGHEVW